jgi:hypothetical protein
LQVTGKYRLQGNTEYRLQVFHKQKSRSILAERLFYNLVF